MILYSSHTHGCAHMSYKGDERARERGGGGCVWI